MVLIRVGGKVGCAAYVSGGWSWLHSLCVGVSENGNKAISASIEVEVELS